MKRSWQSARNDPALCKGVFRCQQGRNCRCFRTDPVLGTGKPQDTTQQTQQTPIQSDNVPDVPANTPQTVTGAPGAPLLGAPGVPGNPTREPIERPRVPGGFPQFPGTTFTKV